MAFPPRVLLFGAAATALRYNTYSRMMAVLVFLYLCIPLVGYFGDFGALSPDGITDLSVKTLLKFCELLRIKMKDS